MLVICLLSFLIKFAHASTELGHCFTRNSNIKSTDSLAGLCGVGFNSLTNQETLPIFKIAYSRCRRDPKNLYFIPDNFFVIPLDLINLERTTQEFDSYSSYMESNSNKITVGGSATIKGFSIGGSYSNENENAKSGFSTSNSFMLLTKLKFKAYLLISNEASGLDDVFNRRVEEIAYELHLGRFKAAVYRAQLLIRDYGTHVITKVTAGAEIDQQVFIDKSEKFQNESQKTANKASVSLGFPGLGSLNVENESKSAKENVEHTRSATTKNILLTKGGPNVRRLADSDIKAPMLYVDHLVGLDHEGRMLYDILPAVEFHAEYPPQLKLLVRELVMNATNEFFDRNTIRGCMDPMHPNFNPLANTDDGSCIDANESYSFGGVYQKCSYQESTGLLSGKSYIPGPRCQTNQLKNPVTGNFSCPNDHNSSLVYESILGFYDRTEPYNRGKKCRIFNYFFCYDDIVDETIHDKVDIQLFWCYKRTYVDTPRSQLPPPDCQLMKIQKIMNDKVLLHLEKTPDVLRSYFPEEFIADDIAERDNIILQVCRENPFRDPVDLDINILNPFGKIKEMQQKADNCTNKIKDSPSGARYEYLKANTENKTPVKLNMCYPHLDKLVQYPDVLHKLLPVLDFPSAIVENLNMTAVLSQSPILIKQLLFPGYTSSKDLVEVAPIQTKAFFGGSFEKGQMNILTGASSCPSNFIAHQILYNVIICIWVDTQEKYPIQFGGMYGVKKSDYGSYSCPRGFSAYPIVTMPNVENIHYEYYYCLRYTNREKTQMPQLNLPPYLRYDEAYPK